MSVDPNVVVAGVIRGSMNPKQITCVKFNQRLELGK